MPMLRVDGEPIVRLTLAVTPRERMVGLLGRSAFDEALLLRPARSVHTVGMRFAIDVAHVDGDGVVVAVTTMPPNRLGRVVWSSRQVLEAAAGAFDRWELRRGSRLTWDELGDPA